MDQTPVVVGAAIIFLIVGSVLGWHGQRVSAAHSDVKVAKNRLRGGRKTRTNGGIWVTGIVIGLILVVWFASHGH